MKENSKTISSSKLPVQEHPISYMYVIRHASGAPKVSYYYKKGDDKGRMEVLSICRFSVDHGNFEDLLAFNLQDKSDIYRQSLL